MGACSWCEWAYIQEGSAAQPPKITFRKKMPGLKQLFAKRDDFSNYAID